VLVAETISVILLDGIGPGKAGAAPIAILLSIALLANLGLVCSVAASIAASSARQSKHEGARALSGWLFESCLLAMPLVAFRLARKSS
jgi:hypothetical protein